MLVSQESLVLIAPVSGWHLRRSVMERAFNQHKGDEMNSTKQRAKVKALARRVADLVKYDAPDVLITSHIAFLVLEEMR